MKSSGYPRRCLATLLLVIPNRHHTLCTYGFPLNGGSLSSFSPPFVQMRPQISQQYVDVAIYSGSERKGSELSSSYSNDLKKTGNEVDWDWREIVQSVFSGDDQRPVILFDGVCNVCNGSVNFALDHDEVGCFRFASLQSRIGKSFLLRADKESSDLSSIVLVDKENTYFKSEAVIRIAKTLDKPLPLIASGMKLFPNFLRNIVYDFVSENRFKFGIRDDSCRLDTEFDSRFIPDP